MRWGPQYVDSKIAVAVTGTVSTVITPPKGASRAVFTFASQFLGTGTATLDLVLQERVPTFVAAPVVATTVTGTTGTFAVQTITMTGEPTDGSVKFGVTGEGTNTVFTTVYMPLREIKNKPAKIADYLAQAALPNATDVAWSVVVGTGASTPTIFTATYRGSFTLAQTAIAVTGDRLYNYQNTGVALVNAGASIVQRTLAASTSTNYDIIRVGPGEQGILNAAGTATVYLVSSTLPAQIVAKVTTAATSVNTASYSLFVDWSS